ncbi:MAG TPA: hypothetical protein VM054_10775 [bacterium]|nr:hypothetical protein [bacterium]
MRLPLGKTLLPNLPPQNRTLFQLLRAFTVSGFRGYITQHKDGSCFAVLCQGGIPVSVVTRCDSGETLSGQTVAQRFSSELAWENCRFVELDQKSLDKARIICQADCYASGLAPTSAEMNRFYSDCISEGRNGLIQLYDEAREFYVPIKQGQIVERPSGEEYDNFRARGGYSVDLYCYRNGQVADKPLSLDNFISPLWLRDFLVRQLNASFKKSIELLLDELGTAEIGSGNLDHWFKRIGEFLETFVCSSRQARVFLEKVRAMMESTEEFQHISRTNP